MKLFALALLMPILCFGQSKTIHRKLSHYDAESLHILNMADSEYYKNNYQNALNLVNDYIERDGKFYYAYFLRGKAKWAIGGMDGIKEDFDRTLELKPDFDEAYCQRGLLEEANDNQAGLADFTMAIKYAKSKDRLAEYYGLRASLKCDMLNWAGALTDANKSLLLNSSDNPNAYQARAQVYMENGEYRKAISDCDKAIDSEFSSSYFVFYVRGVCKSKIGNQEGACEDLQHAVGLSDTYFTREALKKYCK